MVFFLRRRFCWKIFNTYPSDCVGGWQGLKAEIQVKMHEMTYAVQPIFQGDTLGPLLMLWFNDLGFLWLAEMVELEL